MADRIQTTVTPPNTLVPVILSDYFLSDRLEVDGINNPIELSSRLFSLDADIKADSFGRRAL